MQACPRRNGTIRMALSIGFATLLVSLVGGCARVGPPRPTTGYRADVTLRATPRGETQSSTTRLVEVYDKKKRRREMQIDGEAIAVIDRPDLHVSWILRPNTKTFDEVRITSPEAQVSTIPNPFGPRANAAFEDLGLEMVDGSEARKFAVSGEAISGNAWVTEEQIPVKFVGTMRSEDGVVDIEVAYSNVKRGTKTEGGRRLHIAYADPDRGCQEATRGAAATEFAVLKPMGSI
jgi:hypothetical protein